jgi:hypothetical protein
VRTGAFERDSAAQQLSVRMTRQGRAVMEESLRDLILV